MIKTIINQLITTRDNFLNCWCPGLLQTPIAESECQGGKAELALHGQVKM